MKKVIIVELIWLAGLLVLAFFVYAWIFTNKALDINAHDTYNADGSIYSPGLQIIPALFISTGFIAYLIRTIVLKFKTLRITVLLIVFNCLLLIYLERLYQSEVSFFVSAFPANSNNDTPVKGLFYGGDASVFYALRWLPLMRAFLTLILAFASFMIGRNWRKAALK
jgi:hypothetical protein